MTPAVMAILSRRRFDARDLGLQLAARWSATDTSLMVDDGGGVISSWSDRVSRLAVTASGSVRPTWSNNALNGRFPGLTFDGVDDCFVTTSLGNLPVGNAAGEIWCVGKISSATNGTLCGYGNNGTGTERNVFAVGTSGLGRISDGTTQLTDGGTANLLSGGIIGGQWFGSTQNGFINGQAFTTNPGTAAPNTLTARLRIGANPNTAASVFLNGVVSEVLVIVGALTTDQRQKLEGSLAWQYDMQGVLLPSHPYRCSPP